MSAPRRRLILSALVLLVLAGHLPGLASSLEDLDSFNFALGLREFDPRQHQPHPPGYPVFIALGRIARPVAAVFGAGPGAAADARALALVSAVAGAVAVVPLFMLFSGLDGLGHRQRRAIGPDERALAATVLAVTAPLFWFAAARPMSDVPGLMLALAAQALLVAAWAKQRAEAIDTRGRGRGDALLCYGAVLSAVAVGTRSQALWLVAPIFTLALVGRRGAGATRARSMALGVFGVTCLAWMVPLLAASGGIDGYLATLADQAGEDFSGVEMVWTTPTARVLAYALRYVLLDVWGSWLVGVVMCMAAAAGVVALAMGATRALLVAGVLWLPYLVFHLLFQETATSRYALPLVPPLAWLATQGLSCLPRLVWTPLVLAVAAAGLWVTAPALARYAAAGSPISRAMADLAAERPAPDIAAHHMFLRAFQADGRHGVPWSSRHGREWLEVTRRWREGLDSGHTPEGPGALWFIAEPRRTDVACVDAHSVVERQRYDWTFDAPRFIRGTRPDAVAWYAVAPRPGWFIGEGWALTPELAGLAQRDGTGLARAPLLAHVRRRADPVNLMIGGRHLGSGGDPHVRIELALDGAPVGTFAAPAGSFLRVFDLPAGRLAGAGYARLTVHASATGGPAIPPVAIEQFDVQSAGVPVWGFDQGWHEAEYDPRIGRGFRWTSALSTLRVAGADGDVALLISGESPIKYVGRPPEVVVRAGSAVLARHSPSQDFSWRVRVPMPELAASGGLITIATSEIFRPELAGSADRRHLGLRLFEVAIAR